MSLRRRPDPAPHRASLAALEQLLAPTLTNPTSLLVTHQNQLAVVLLHTDHQRTQAELEQAAQLYHAFGRGILVVK